MSKHQWSECGSACLEYKVETGRLTANQNISVLCEPPRVRAAQSESAARPGIAGYVHKVYDSRGKVNAN